MPLAPGIRLGPYEVLASIGAGGMGEVYRARDTRLKRDVALKVLPDSFAGNPERMARFRREAEVLASLNHPNIAQIYGVEDRALVMELVEGETLPSPLPIDTALNYARQIAEALEYAHERGVIHRDLKPANIMVTTEGTVKVLDFGLAKAGGTPVVQSDDSPTHTMGPTRASVILGTAGYMSPEQARGKAVDKRADIWAFGVVLYEMLTGKRLFHGEDLAETLASVVKEEPCLDAAPAKVRRLLRKCLEKDPKRRLRDIGDVWELLEDEPEFAPAKRSILPWVVAGVAVAGLAVALWAPWRGSRGAEQPLVRLDVDLGPEISLRPSGSNATSSVIISPDGTRLVYVANVVGGPSRLFTRRLDQPNATELPGTEGAIFPFFSPDGRWVGFATVNKLNKISAEGGAVVPLADMRTFGASWGENGNIIADRLQGSGMVQIPSGGGAAIPATVLASGEQVDGYPQILPGGKAVLFTAYADLRAEVDQATIEVVSLADRRRKTLVRGGTSPHYVAASNAAGDLVYSNRGTLFAIAFDLNRLETRGTAVPVLDGAGYEPIGAAAHFDISRTGTLVYRKASSVSVGRVTTVQWLDAVGRKEPLLAKPGSYEDLRLSPDGKRLAVSVIDGSTQDIWVYDEQRDAMTRLTFGGFYKQPIWNPDGRYVVFGSLNSAANSMFWTRADGGGQPEPLTQSKNVQSANSFSPDGKRLAYTEVNRVGSHRSAQIWTVGIEDTGRELRAGKPEQFLKTQFNDCCPVFSPEGQWLAYLSDESGKFEVYVRAFPPPASGPGAKWQISNSGGRLPVWSRRDHELFYQSGGQIMAVKYTVKGNMFTPEKPRVWAAKLGGATEFEGAAWFDLAPDGKRVAVEVPVSTPEAPKPDHEVTFLFNFANELRRRVPLGK